MSSEISKPYPSSALRLLWFDEINFIFETFQARIIFVTIHKHTSTFVFVYILCVSMIICFFKLKPAYGVRLSLLGSEMCIRCGSSPVQRVCETVKSALDPCGGGCFQYAGAYPSLLSTVEGWSAAWRAHRLSIYADKRNHISLLYTYDAPQQYIGW